MNNDFKDKLKEKIISNLKHVFDPEIPVNIYDLGLIYNIELEENSNKIYANIDMTLTSPGCPVAENLVNETQLAATSIEDIEDAYVKLTFDPPWDKEKVSEDGRDMMLANGFLL